MQESTFIQPTGISNRLYVAQYVEHFRYHESFHAFYLNSHISYHPFCDDFGPMNMACIVDYIRLIDSKLEDFPDRKLVLCVASGKRELTNAVFLLGTGLT